MKSVRCRAEQSYETDIKWAAGHGYRLPQLIIWAGELAEVAYS